MSSIFTINPFGRIISIGNVNGIDNTQLFGPYFRRNEICVLFSRTNEGKSILANDISVYCATGHKHWGEEIKNEVEQQKTLLFELELSPEQIASRYGGLEGLNISLDNLIHVSVNYLELCNSNLSPNGLVEEICSVAEKEKSNIIILDNITYLLEQINNGKHVMQFMKALKVAKEKYDLSILLIAHATKNIGSIRKPITTADLGGSKFIADFADTVSALGASSQGNDVKYLKLLKSRISEKSNEVATLCIEPEPYLHFEFIQMDDETEHLEKKEGRSVLTEKTKEKIKELHKKGMTIRQIANGIGESHSTVGRFVKQLKDII